MEPDLVRGIDNLLFGCARIEKGDRVLLISEEEGLGYCDADAVEATADRCRDFGAEADILELPFQRENVRINDTISRQFSQSDAIICFSRLFDQLRFADFPNCQKCIINYAATVERLASPFGTGDQAAFEVLKHCLETLIADSDEIVVTCPNGTRFQGPGLRPHHRFDETRVRRFPLLVFAPVLAAQYSGRVAMPKVLLGTGRNFYEPYCLYCDGILHAHFSNGRLTGFDGLAADVRRADDFLDFVAERYGHDRNFVHSWHAGIHPANTASVSVYDNNILWSNSSFGNPRILHFHACGRELPGDITWNVLDPTIAIDGMEVWKDGRLAIDRRPGAEAILDQYPAVAESFANPAMHVGL
ncbi:MAG: hypothetical protein OXC91_09500 [Rhodobacteraceae bacterium]|nr:hypothetical protein [Paracoccaceae bacterium]